MTWYKEWSGGTAPRFWLQGPACCAADFIALLGILDQAFPRAPVIVVNCDNDSIHHARKVTAYLKEHPRLETAVRRPAQPARQPGR